MTSKSSVRYMGVYGIPNKQTTLSLTASIYSIRFCCLSLDGLVTLIVFEAVSRQGVKTSIINNRPQIDHDPPAEVENISFFFKQPESFILFPYNFGLVWPLGVILMFMDLFLTS